MAAFAKRDLNSTIVSPYDMTPDTNIELAGLALQRTLAEMRLIEKSEITDAEFREHFRTAMTRLDKATDYMRRFRESLRKEGEVPEQRKG